MADVVRRDMDNLNAELTVVISVADYEPKLQSALQKQSKQMQLKGFRKGKIPVNYVKKMYGQAILADEVNKLIEDTLNNYIKEHNLRLLGYPIPSDQQDKYDFDTANLNDFKFNFDIGLAPEFDLNDLQGSTFSIYGVEVPADMVDKDMEALQKRLGERIQMETEIEENDIVEFEAAELAGDTVKENGWATDFSVLVKDVTDELRAILLTKKKGDVIRLNIYEVEKGKSREHVIKYLLGATNSDDLSEVGADFEATITEVSRIQLPEMNSAFFEKMFGEGTSEQEARAKIEKDISGYYDKQAESLLYRDFQDSLMENNEIALPDEFLKRWINVSSSAESKDRPSITDREYVGFAKNLRWSLIQGKLIKQLQIEVSNDDVFEFIKEKIRAYFGNYGDELVILNTANRLMQDEKQVEQAYQELQADKLLAAMRNIVKLNVNKVSIATFDEIIQEEVRKRKELNDAAMSNEDNISEEVEEGIEEITEDI